MNNEYSNGEWWTIKQVAGYGNVSTRTIDRWVEEKEKNFPKPKRFSKRVRRWWSEEVKRWFKLR